MVQCHLDGRDGRPARRALGALRDGVAAATGGVASAADPDPDRQAAISTPAARASAASDASASSVVALARSRPITRLTPASR